MTKTVPKPVPKTAIKIAEKPQHGGQIYQFAREKVAADNSNDMAALGTILDFSASINPIQPKIDWPLVNDNAQQALIHYPDSEQVALKQLLAKKFALSYEQITLTNGISSAIMSLFSAFKPDNTLLITPIYSEYIRAAQLYSQQTFELKVNKLEDLQPDHYLPYLKPLTENSVVVLVNPSTPLGLYFSPEKLNTFVQRLKELNCWLWIDESFLPFVGFDAQLSFRKLLARNPKMLILQSLTKYYACPGLRIGALFSAANALDNFPWPSWPISVLDEQVLSQSLTDGEHDSQTITFFNIETPHFIQCLQACSVIESVTETAANFLFVHTRVSAGRLVKALKNFNILIRDCEDFGLGTHSCRIAIRSTDDNNRLIDALQQCASLLKEPESNLAHLDDLG